MDKFIRFETLQFNTNPPIRKPVLSIHQHTDTNVESKPKTNGKKLPSVSAFVTTWQMRS